MSHSSPHGNESQDSDGGVTPRYSEGHFVTAHELPVEPHLAVCELLSARLRVTCAAALIVELLQDELDDGFSRLFNGD